MLAVSLQRPVAERLGAEFDVRKPRSPEQPHLLCVDAPRREVGAPADVRAAADQRLGQPDVVFRADVEHRIGEKQVADPVVALGAEDVSGDRLRIHRPHAPPVDRGVRTIDAVVGASPLGLYVEHPAPLPVIARQLGLELHLDRRQVAPAAASAASVAGVDRRDVDLRPAALQRPDQLRERPFAFAVDAVVGAQLPHESLGVDREPCAADDQGGVACRAYDVRQRPVLGQETPPVERVGPVDIAQRQPDVTGCQHADTLRQLPVREQVAVRHIDAYPAYRALQIGFQVRKSERINGVGRGVPVGRYE